MNEIKPNWRIAQQISGRHTLISLKITLPLFCSLTFGALILLKLLGYEQSGIILRDFFHENKQTILSSLLFFHFVPVNFYAIIKLFKQKFSHFELKLVPITDEQNAVSEIFNDKSFENR